MTNVYKATRQEDGSLRIHDVPIFLNCKRGDVEFDDEWIEAALQKAEVDRKTPYYPPLHVRHHERATEQTDSVRAAGWIEIQEARMMAFKGSSKLTIFADYVITDETVAQDMLRHRYPYRSVEIFNVEKPAIDGLALLDHEAPFLELPMLMVKEDSLEGTSEFSMEFKGADGLVASFKHGGEARLLFKDDDEVAVEEEQPTDESVTEGEPEQGKLNFEADANAPGSSSDEGTADEDETGDDATSPNAEKIVEMIEDGSITVADMEAIVAAIQARMANQTSDGEEGDVAPAAAPGAEAMKKEEMDEKMAAMQGEIDALRARDTERENDRQIETDVAAAMEQLADIPLGSDLKDRLLAFRKEHGKPAFDAYVESQAQTFANLESSEDTAERFAKQNNSFPEVALKYESDGTDAVERAASFAREWKELKEAGYTNMSEERYVAVNMSKEAANG